MATAVHVDAALPADAVFAALAPNVQALVEAVYALYDGSFADCAEDIRRRRAGRPYLFRLDFDLADDLRWLQCLANYQAARGEDFADVVAAAALKETAR